MSKTWDKLSAQHEQELANGISGFRQTVATRYFTSKSENNLEDIRRFAQGVKIDMDDSMFGDPVMVEIDGHKVTHDLVRSITEVDTIRVDWSKIKHVCEIGAGYGRTAYIILKRYPHIKYKVIDRYPAIGLSERHLTEQFPESDLTFQSPGSPVKDVDLFLAISVMSELSVDEQAKYFEMFQKGKYLYLKDWIRKRNKADNRYITRFTWPIPSTWKELYWEKDPHYGNFFYSLYEIL